MGSYLYIQSEYYVQCYVTKWSSDTFVRSLGRVSLGVDENMFRAQILSPGEIREQRDTLEWELADKHN